MPDPRTNGAYSTVATAPSPATSGTSLTLTTGDGARFPVGTFDAVVWAAGQQSIFVAGSGTANAEIVRATRTAGSDVLTIARIQQGTSARSIVVGDQVEVGPTTGWIDDMLALPSYARGLSLINTYDRSRGVYNWKSSNTRRIDKGAGRSASGGMSEHVFIGDSGGAGCNSSLGTAVFDRVNAVPMSLQNALANSGIPVNGTGLIRTVDSTSFADSRGVAAGTWTNFGPFAYATVAGATWTLTPNRSGTCIDVMYLDYASGGGTFTITLDGTVVATVTVNGTNVAYGANSGVTGWKIFRIPNVNVIGNFSKIVYTATAVGTSAQSYLAGIDVWSPNAGLRMHNIAQSSASASGTGVGAWVDVSSTATLGGTYNPVCGLGGAAITRADCSTTSGANTLTTATANTFNSQMVGMPIDQVASTAGILFPPNTFISGFTSGTVVTLSYLVNGVLTNAPAAATASSQTFNIGRPPDCVHIELASNDLAALAASPSTIATAITTIRNRYPNSDCILHLFPEMSTSFVSTANQLAWQQQFFQLCDTLDVPGFDWRDQVGSFSQGQADGWYGDPNVHLTTQAYVELGAGLSALIGPGSGRGQVPTTADPYLDRDVVPLGYLTGNRTTTATATSTTTTESVVMQLKKSPNTLRVGSTVRYSAYLVPGATTTITTTKMRIGVLGTTSDAAVVTMSATASAATTPRVIQGNATVQAIGASGTFLGAGTEQIGATSATGSATATSGTFDTTKALFITLTVTNGTSTTVSVKSGYLELIP